MAPLEGMSEAIAKGQFISGLKGKIRAKVSVLGQLHLIMLWILSSKWSINSSTNKAEIGSPPLGLTPPQSI